MPDDARPFSNCLLDLAPPDIAWFQERSDIILVPIGSCEQHGAHLPLGTDTITALEVARRAAEQADVPYTAPFWAGYSPQHMRETESAVGTITLRAETLNAVLYDILRSLIHHGWNKLILVNGHGSNVKVLDPLLRRNKYENGALVALYKPYVEGYQYFSFPMDHGEFSRTGVIGNPMTATPEKGEEALERFSNHLARAIDEFRALD